VWKEGMGRKWYGSENPGFSVNIKKSLAIAA